MDPLNSPLSAWFQQLPLLLGSLWYNVGRREIYQTLSLANGAAPPTVHSVYTLRTHYGVDAFYISSVPLSLDFHFICLQF